MLINFGIAKADLLCHRQKIRDDLIPNPALCSERLFSIFCGKTKESVLLGYSQTSTSEHLCWTAALTHANENIGD